MPVQLSIHGFAPLNVRPVKLHALRVKKMIIRFSCRVAFTIFFSCEVSHLQSQESSDVLQFGKIQEGFRSSIDLITSIRVAYKCRPLSAVGAAEIGRAHV